ncbi:hypothetical protein [Rhizobium leguminosarum]|uniref:hypothetical protein n=1 Tax=Rhizobium leguminosarum TaxID=384 RepID=UPI001FE13AE3|nr:hypothetical protein [Rhizobium leguminosarum]
MLFFILFALPYIVGFVALAFWRQGWRLMAATVAMIIVYFFPKDQGMAQARSRRMPFQLSSRLELQPG